MDRILLIEDDLDLSEMLVEYLVSENFDVIPVYDGEQAKVELSNTFDLILLDLMLPRTSGIDVLKFIRQHTFLPVIILTAKSSEQDKTIGFNLGADDYMVKPFSLIELSARIRAQLRRSQKYSTIKQSDIVKVLTYKDLSIDFTSFSVKKDKEKIALTKKEFEILTLLVSNQGTVFSKARMYELVWKETYYGEENIINVSINRLRKKLSKNSQDEYIKTLWGIGYTMEEITK
ncbi:hypothetical protein RV11_GL003163 [Enterococcus phoeniculicola]|uniref:DNA-binding response regulator n=1 Tax=Enterococcus phoeniculicola ATCC BAA-412 TaxID=1158610 RepID=R3TNE6_9ENTE|nr:response regulator transcription factor [Enterococcus phoeniculicola]EOL43019.1 hypothetical protein UC3_01996 [Enterococcus phoeniculicola ATCC BAA-412]EOT76623.1 hypothetical protein I589_01580 [Enterococcus phoeniculicola ATCC BAA-412]OJG72192.1 hypothetical protein RV11_GL003163 [Enterococcus phoeniculicola]